MPTSLLPMCSILLALDPMLALCLCSTVLLTYMLSVGVFMAAVLFQRRSDQVWPVAISAIQ